MNNERIDAVRSRKIERISTVDGKTLNKSKLSSWIGELKSIYKENTGQGSGYYPRIVYVRKALHSRVYPSLDHPGG